MPLIKVQTSLDKTSFPETLLNELSRELAKSTGKPEAYVMALLETDLPMIFAGSNKPSCFIEIKSIGSLTPNLMAKSFSKLISDNTIIPANRIYINFEDVNPTQWGFNGNTFG